MKALLLGCLKISAAMVLLLVFSQLSYAETFHVYEGQSIQLAIDGAVNGDTILVHPGTYVISGTAPGSYAMLIQNKYLTIESTNGPEATIIHCDNPNFNNDYPSAAVYYKHTNSLGHLLEVNKIKGFKIEGSFVDTIRVGVLMPTEVVGNILSGGGSISPGAGVYGEYDTEHYNSALYVHNNIIKNCYYGINANHSWECGQCDSYALIAVNNTVYHSYIGILCNGINIEVYSSYSNPYNLNHGHDIRNNIVWVYWGNIPVYVFNYNHPPYMSFYRPINFCDIQNGSVPPQNEWFIYGQSNIDLNPLFVNATNGDFRLAAGSPCINAGDPSSIYNDLDGSRNDMGAYGGPDAITSQVVETLAIINPVEGAVVAPGEALDITWQTTSQSEYVDITIRYTGSSEPIFTQEVDNTGEFALPANTLNFGRSYTLTIFAVSNPDAYDNVSFRTHYRFTYKALD